MFQVPGYISWQNSQNIPIFLKLEGETESKPNKQVISVVLSISKCRWPNFPEGDAPWSPDMSSVTATIINWACPTAGMFLVVLGWWTLQGKVWKVGEVGTSRDDFLY